MKSSKIEAIIRVIWLITLAASVFLAVVGLDQIAMTVNIISWIALITNIGVQIYNMKD